MWIRVPGDDESDEPWIGKISAPSVSQNSWQFELFKSMEPTTALRQVVDSFGASQKSDPFFEKEAIIGHLDLQRFCTLIRPFVTMRRAGTIGYDYPFSRVNIKGTFEGLLTSTNIIDPSEPVFTDISFDSPSLAAWYSAEGKIHTHFNDESGEFGVTKGGKDVFEFALENVGKLKIEVGVHVSSDKNNPRVTKLEPYASVKLAFPHAVSLDDVIQRCLELELVFGHIIGYRDRLPSFGLKTNTVMLENPTGFQTGELELSDSSCSDREFPSLHDRLTLRSSLGVEIDHILRSFYKNPRQLSVMIRTIEICKYRHSVLTDKFFQAMPILEEYLRKFRGAGSKNYAAAKEKYFEYIDKSEDPDIAEYARCHIKVVNSKEASLRDNLEAAIKEVNAFGFSFPSEIASQIAKRRASLFHKGPLINSGKHQQFYRETRVVIGLLQLFVLLDLGIDIRKINNPYLTLPELREFSKE